MSRMIATIVASLLATQCFGADTGDALSQYCQTQIRAHLKSPSSYQLIDMTMVFEPDVTPGNAKFELPSFDCEGQPAAFDPKRNCSGHPNAVTETSGQWEVVLSYDAANSFGASLRKAALCRARVAAKDSPLPSAEKITVLIND